MLYIFLVNNGKTMTFDMNLALDTVENLKSAIYEQYQIPVNNQVLLISGGESLNLSDRVCKYSSAGTDTSPIFLFCKNQVDVALPLPSNSETDLDEEMKERVESCLQMEANFNTVVARTEMAHQLYETDKLLYFSCDKLVHDQHLQQQGWAAVVANLEDIVCSFKNKAKRVEQLYNDILMNKSTYYKLLQSFENDKEMLAKIPILKSLNAKGDAVTLLEWILRKDSKNSLDELYCMDELESFDQEKLNNLKADIDMVIKQCDNVDMKEIKGLETRLFALDKLMDDAKKVYDKQGILTKGFNQNHTRISDLRDTSILPDLCQNHKEQLQIMLRNHTDLIDYKNRCLLAKKELSDNLHHRLRWIVHIEEQLKQKDDILVIYGLKLKKLREKLEIIQNLHLTPQIYLNSIVEVLRRRSFSDTFYHWQCVVSQTAKQMVESEIEQRRKFTAQLEKHFLKFFFPGMNDYPANFTTECEQIDQMLPQISFDDLNYLKEQLPEMSSHLVVPSPVPLPFTSPVDYEPKNLDQSSIEPTTNAGECLQSKSFAQIECQDFAMGTSLTAKEIAQLESTKLDLESCLREKNQLIEDLVSKLSISEKKCLENGDLVQKLSHWNGQAISLMRTLQSDALGEIGSQFSDFSQNLSECFHQVRGHLDRYNAQMEEERSNFTNMIKQKEEFIAQLEEQIGTLTKDLANKNVDFDKLSAERDDAKSLILSQVCEIEKLKEDIDKMSQEDEQKRVAIDQLNVKLQSLKTSLEQSKQEITAMLNNFVRVEMQLLTKRFEENVETLRKEYEEKLKSVETKLTSDKDEEVQKLRETLSLEHKNELDSLRHRFKLAISTTSIERTSSETSLEKVQLDIVDQSAQEKEIQKMKSMLNEQKAEYEQSIARLRSEFESNIQTIKAELERERKFNSNENLRKILNDPEFSPDQIIQRMKLYETLFSRLNAKLPNVDIENLDLNKCQEVLAALQQDLNEVGRTLESVSSFTRSFISIPATPDSPKQGKELDAITSKYKLPKNLELITQNNDDKISITSCEFGDNVLVYYEKKLENFIVFSLTGNLHYIHSDSLKECDFGKDVQPNEFQWIIAKVMEKEYCQIKKEENRYKLPLNTKFYRVKIKQISKCNTSTVKLDQGNLMHRSYMPSTSNRTILSNIMSFFGTSSDSMSRSAYNFNEPSN